MANVIKLKNSGTANSAPTSLEAGELAINYADGKIYYKNSSNVIVEFSSAGAGGSGMSVSETPPASPSAGDLWFESDTGKTFVYYDSFWVESSGADGSQGATGSAGLEGGTTTLTAKGDILARDVSAPVRLPVGTNGKVLTANSSTTTGLEWVSPIVYATVANLSTLSNTVTSISDNANTLSNTVTALSGNVSTISNTVVLKSNIASPTFTGIPTAPTAANTVNNTQIATTAYVKTVINDLINSAPSTLDTLGEIATSLANNESLSSTLTTSIALKAPLADPTFTGTVSGITKTMVGLGSVDNTTDLAKPISNATQTALDLKAPLANATFTGTIVLPATTSIANVSSTEIEYLDGVTSAIQTQLNAKAPLSSPTFTGTVTGTPTAGTTSTGTSGFGYMGLPQNSATTGSYGVVAADAGTHIYSSATRTITIPANATIAMPIGSTIVFIAGSGATVTIAITSDTMYLAGLGTTGSRTLAAFGMATAVKITSTSWIISGNGLT